MYPRMPRNIRTLTRILTSVSSPSCFPFDHLLERDVRELLPLISPDRLCRVLEQVSVCLLAKLDRNRLSHCATILSLLPSASSRNVLPRRFCILAVAIATVFGETELLLFLRRSFTFHRREVGYPTLPSKLTLSSFFASTANSIGSSLNTCLQKPLTIRLTACSASRPRCWR